MMKILITGGLGHIGSFILTKINKLKIVKKVYVVDNVVNEKYEPIKVTKNKKIFFIFGDLTNTKVLNSLPKTDVVIHLASLTNAEKSFENPEKIIFNNLKCFKNVVHYCTKNKSKLIHISSTSVYGKQNGIVDESCKKLLPQSPYARIKLDEEEILKKDKNLKYITLRFGTICGVSPGMRFHTAVNKFCLNTFLKIPIPIWGKVLNLHRPYLSLKDAFITISYILNKKFFPCDIFNILSENKTLKEILLIIKYYKYKPEIKIVNTKLLNQNNYYISNNKFSNNCVKLNSKISNDIKETLNFLKIFIKYK